MIMRFLVVLFMALCLALLLPAQVPVNDVGQFYPEFQEYANDRAMSMSYLSREWPEPEQWRVQCRAKMMELLGYTPEPVTLNPEILEETKKEGYTRYKVRYSITPQRRTEAYLLIPDGLRGPAPAVIALHDHGGFYFFGKEKITQTENQPEILRRFIDEAYGGRTYADELVRHGFVVLCPDAFYFGSQRLQEELVPDLFKEDPGLNSADRNVYIEAFNALCSRHESIMAKYMFASGTTWTGILSYGDRRSVDYLLTRPEIDPEHIRCM